MTDLEQTQGPLDLRLPALSRWDNEGGALADATYETKPDVPDMTNAELVLLRVRVMSYAGKWVMA